MQGCGGAGAPGNGVPVNIFVREWHSRKHVSYQREHWYQSVPVIFFFELRLVESHIPKYAGFYREKDRYCACHHIKSFLRKHSETITH